MDGMGLGDDVLFAELEALKITYGDDWNVTLGQPLVVTVVVSPYLDDQHTQQFVSATLCFEIGPSYPVEAPTTLLQNTKGLSDSRIAELQFQLSEQAKLLIGDVMLLQLCQLVADHLTAVNYPEGECVFCLSTLAQDTDDLTKIVKLPCYHCFHFNCFAQWWNWQQNELFKRKQQVDQEYGYAAPLELQKHKLQPDASGCFAVNCPVCRAEITPKAVTAAYPTLLATTVVQAVQPDPADSAVQDDASWHSWQERFRDLYNRQQKNGGIIENKGYAISLEELNRAFADNSFHTSPSALSPERPESSSSPLSSTDYTSPSVRHSSPLPSALVPQTAAIVPQFRGVTCEPVSHTVQVQHSRDPHQAPWQPDNVNRLNLGALRSSRNAPSPGLPMRGPVDPLFLLPAVPPAFGDPGQSNSYLSRHPQGHPSPRRPPQQTRGLPRPPHRPLQQPPGYLPPPPGMCLVSGPMKNHQEQMGPLRNPVRQGPIGHLPHVSSRIPHDHISCTPGTNQRLWNNPLLSSDAAGSWSPTVPRDLPQVGRPTARYPDVLQQDMQLAGLMLPSFVGNGKDSGPRSAQFANGNSGVGNKFPPGTGLTPPGLEPRLHGHPFQHGNRHHTGEFNRAPPGRSAPRRSAPPPLSVGMSQAAKQAAAAALQPPQDPATLTAKWLAPLKTSVAASDLSSSSNSMPKGIMSSRPVKDPSYRAPPDRATAGRQGPGHRPTGGPRNPCGAFGMDDKNRGPGFPRGQHSQDLEHAGVRRGPPHVHPGPHRPVDSRNRSGPRGMHQHENGWDGALDYGLDLAVKQGHINGGMGHDEALHGGSRECLGKENKCNEDVHAAVARVTASQLGGKVGQYGRRVDDVANGDNMYASRGREQNGRKPWSGPAAPRHVQTGTREEQGLRDAGGKASPSGRTQGSSQAAALGAVPTTMKWVAKGSPKAAEGN